MRLALGATEPYIRVWDVAVNCSTLSLGMTAVNCVHPLRYDYGGWRAIPYIRMLDIVGH